MWGEIEMVPQWIAGALLGVSLAVGGFLCLWLPAVAGAHLEYKPERIIWPLEERE